MLLLVLARVLLIQGVWRLESGAGGEHVQLSGRRRREAGVEPIKEIPDIAVRVERSGQLSAGDIVVSMDELFG